MMVREWRTVNPKDAAGRSKPPMSTIPANVLMELGVAMMEGALKYGRHNYRTIPVEASVYYDATMRHLMTWWEGEDIDLASGVSHITKAIASLVVLRDALMQETMKDDRPPKSLVWFEPLVEQTENLIRKHPESVTPCTEVSNNCVGIE